MFLTVSSSPDCNGIKIILVINLLTDLSFFPEAQNSIKVSQAGHYITCFVKNRRSHLFCDYFLRLDLLPIVHNLLLYLTMAECSYIVSFYFIRNKK